MSTPTLGITRRDLEELAGASCAETDPELFFPLGNQPIAFEEAANVCFTCPVKAACLEGARKREESWGVWGGVNFERSPAAEPYDPTEHNRCGSYSGYARHKKRDETPCVACRKARADYERAARELRNEEASA